MADIQAFPVDLSNVGSLGSLVATGQTQAANAPNSNGSITQIERLFTARSRGAFKNPDGGGDRGTRAFIKLLTNDLAGSTLRTSPDEGFGVPQNLTGSGNPLDLAIQGTYANFLLTGIHCSLDEKLQVTQTFGDGEVVYYFGRQPIMFTMTGSLIDSVDNDWFVQWLTMYGHVMRGSQLAKNYELLKIVLPNMQITGTIPHMSWQQASDNDVQINFEFQFLAKQIIPTPVTAPTMPLSNAPNLLSFDQTNQFLSQGGINGIKAQAGAVLSVVQNPNSNTGQIAAALSGFGGGLSGIIGPGRLSPPGQTGLSNGIDSITNSINSVTHTVTDMFYSVSANLAGIRASLFSPIYGVLTSLTKLVRNVLGDVAAIFNSIISPIADIIRDVTNISSQAMGLVNLVNSAINTNLGLGNLSDFDVRFSLGSLLNTRGVIATQPFTLSMTLRQLVNLGQIPIGTGFMQNPPRPALSYSFGNHVTKIALLNSGPAPTPQAAAFL